MIKTDKPITKSIQRVRDMQDEAQRLGTELDELEKLNVTVDPIRRQVMEAIDLLASIRDDLTTLDAYTD